MAYTGSVANYQRAISELTDPNSAYRKGNPNIPEWKINSSVAKYKRMIDLVNAGNSPAWAESVILAGDIGSQTDRAYEQSQNAKFDNTVQTKDVGGGLQKARLEAFSNAQMGGLSSRVRKKPASPTMQTTAPTQPTAPQTGATSTSTWMTTLKDKLGKMTNSFGGK